MSKITNQLNMQLENNMNEEIIKDETMNQWFKGYEIAEDVRFLREEFIDLHIGRGDVVLVCLPNTAAYIVITQALWEVGAVMHPIAATTPELELKKELQEHDYVASIVGPELVDAALDDCLAIVTALRPQTYPLLHIIRNRELMGHDARVPDEDDLA